MCLGHTGRGKKHFRVTIGCGYGFDICEKCVKGRGNDFDIVMNL